MMNTFRTRPNWVDEEPLIQSILNHFLDQVDVSAKPLFRINERNTPELYDHAHDDPRYLWDLVKTLDNEYHIFTVKKQRNRSGRESYENAQLFFNAEKEGQIREWLNRPAFDPYTLTWNQSFHKIRHLFEDEGRALERPLRVEGKSAGEVLQAFAELSREIKTPQTLRNLSAKCFWGDSKFLDAHQELVNALFPLASQAILPRPMMLNIALPERFTEVLFIENLDSFLMMKLRAQTEPSLMHTALVYSAGFKGTSPGVRKRGEVVFSVLTASSTESLREFERWWLDQHNTDIHCFFWGDMDYAGMAILSALRRSFPNIQAWRPGYRHMLAFHEQGHGHKIRDSKKMQQLDPRHTGCEFADNVLLPAIRASQRFLDQEIIAERDFSREL